jgi:C4-type Zn-finger protein
MCFFEKLEELKGMLERVLRKVERLKDLHEDEEVEKINQALREVSILLEIAKLELFPFDDKNS